MDRVRVSRQAGRIGESAASGVPRASAPDQGGSRMAAQLKLYVPPGENEPLDNRPEPDVRIRLGDLLPIITVAHRLNFTWLRDFLDDEVAVSEDLYEVMQTINRRKPTPA